MIANQATKLFPILHVGGLRALACAAWALCLVPAVTRAQALPAVNPGEAKQAGALVPTPGNEHLYRTADQDRRLSRQPSAAVGLADGDLKAKIADVRAMCQECQAELARMNVLLANRAEAVHEPPARMAAPAVSQACVRNMPRTDTGILPRTDTGILMAVASPAPAPAPAPNAGPVPTASPTPAAGPVPTAVLASATGPMPVAGPVPTAGPMPVVSSVPAAGPVPKGKGNQEMPVTGASGLAAERVVSFTSPVSAVAPPSPPGEGTRSQGERSLPPTTSGRTRVFAQVVSWLAALVICLSAVSAFVLLLRVRGVRLREYLPFQKWVLTYRRYTERGVPRKTVDKPPVAPRLPAEPAVPLLGPLPGVPVYGVSGVPARVSVASKPTRLDGARDAFKTAVIVSEPFAVDYGRNYLSETVVVAIDAGTTGLDAMTGTISVKQDQTARPPTGGVIDDAFYKRPLAAHSEARPAKNMERDTKEYYGFLPEVNE